MNKKNRSLLSKSLFSIVIFFFLLSSCETFTDVKVFRDRYIELRLIGDGGIAYYGTFSFEKISQFNQYKIASSSFIDDMNRRVERLGMDLEKKVPGSILFKKDNTQAYYYKFDTTRVDNPFKIQVYDNNVFKREIVVRQDDVMKSIVINFN